MCAIGERPTTTRCGLDSTGSTYTSIAPSLWQEIGMTVIPSGTCAELLGRAEQEQPRLAVGDRPLRLADHRRLGAGAADPAVDLAGRGDDGA